MSDSAFNPETLTVMVIDDHDPIRKAIKRILTQMKFETIIECFDGLDAQKVIEKRPIDLIILDLYMRNVSGFELLRRIRDRDVASDIPVIIVTGEASKDDIVKSADLGADDYLLKPFQANDLEKKITLVLNKFFSPGPLLRTLRQGERLLLCQNYAEALKTFEEAAVVDPTSMRVKHAKALTLWHMGRVDEALSVLELATQENQTYYKNFATIADILNSQGRSAEAVEAMRRELALNPKQGHRQTVLAKALLKQSDFDGAITHFRLALKDNPKFKNALMGMGHALARSNNLEKALYYFRRVRRYHPKATAALEAIVQYCRSANDLKKAENLLKDERNAHPGRPDTYLVLGRLYLELERLADALSIVNELLAASPEDVLGLELKGVVSMKMKDFETAANCFATANRLLPSTPRARQYAEALICVGKYVEAITTLEKSLRSEPGDAQTIFMLAGAHRSTNQHAKACILYRRAAFLGADPKICNSELKNSLLDIKNRRLPKPRKIAS